jgi:sulfide:quinone oxidoreductase
VTLRVVVLGAGFGGLELSTWLSDALGDELDLVLIDREDAFVFGGAKLDVMFGQQTIDAARHPYRSFVKRGVRFRQETIRAIDPGERRVRTNAATYDADILVIALGADYDVEATPGLADGGINFYSVAGAWRAREALSAFMGGPTIVGVTSPIYKCPPAPAETAIRLADYLVGRDLRAQSEVTIVMPFSDPVPASPQASEAMRTQFAERGIRFVADRLVRSLDSRRRTAVLDDGSELPYALFLGVPVHRVPDVVQRCGLVEDGWIHVDPATCATRHPGVYAIGDVTDSPVPKAGVYAEAAARVVAQAIIDGVETATMPSGFPALGSCYVDFGTAGVGRLDVDVTSATPMSTFFSPSPALAAEREQYGTDRRARWFGKTA